MKPKELRKFLIDGKGWDRTYPFFVSSDIDIEMYGTSINRLLDDIELMPEIPSTKKFSTPNFKIPDYMTDYSENFQLSEILAFVYSSINQEWNIVKAKELKTGKEHFYLENGELVYDPSLLVITTKDAYAKIFIDIERINNSDIKMYLETNNNLYKYYKSFSLFQKKDKNFSIQFINDIVDRFTENVNSQYIINEYKIKETRNHSPFWNFEDMRIILAHKRKYEIDNEEILSHPEVDNEINEEIKTITDSIVKRVKNNIGKDISYKRCTLGNCYMLSTICNIYDEQFKLIQGGFPYDKHIEFFKETIPEYYQHSWLEYKNVVYDPALRVITPKKLYYAFFEKIDEYSKEETKSLLKKTGGAFAYYRDWLEGLPTDTAGRLLFLNRGTDEEMTQKGNTLISKIETEFVTRD